MGKITPFLWFNDEAEQAVEYYLSVFPNSQVLEVARYGSAGPGVEGSVMTIRFELDGNEFIALNGGPTDNRFDDSISFVVSCADQDEVDRYWDALSDGGEGIACGWLKDRFGLRWQIVPDGLTDLFSDPDPERAQRAMQAMLSQVKLDLPAISAAADAVSVSG